MSADPENQTAANEHIDAVRAFNRFYTSQLELLNEHLHASSFTLTETRVLFEIGHRDHVVASDLVEDLRLDAGYLSRILARFHKAGLISRTPRPGDARQNTLTLTAEGEAALAPQVSASRAQIAERLSRLDEGEKDQLIDAMRRVERLFGRSHKAADKHGEPVFRDLEPGDIGWISHRQAVLYNKEYGWDLTYEALVAKILGDFGLSRDPARERAWVAELDGRIVGSIFLMKATEELARLRLLYVEPEARGLGLGSRLVEECISKARALDYRRMTLWTQGILTPARKIYDRAGFTLIKEEPHHSFGHDLMGETWEMDL